MALVVMEELMSTRIGSPPVGIPKAIGSGVKTGAVPPKGAMVASEGSEQATIAIRPRSAARPR